ncbi:MAG TPA: SUMF1/EgtB/PvdO family nonheme iron enzyme [Phycisphaerae bacterium]|nr:SUMF1/EgtB/PvdO family nonheme iron enzyme [Phycisphaerae bacterium]
MKPATRSSKLSVSTPWVSCILGAITLLSTGVNRAAADVFNMPGGQKSLDFVTVGNAGNLNDPRPAGDGTTGLGGVAYNYQIGKFDVTASQYSQFLNAVAATDTFNLYNAAMANPASSGNTSVGAGIVRSGVSGSFTYSVVAGHENYPVNFVGWGDAARFCNWLQNGQPVGPQGAGTTETGAYTLNGATSAAALQAITRNTGATYAIPTESEWYKAAYYDPNKGGAGVPGYWMFASRSDTAPSNLLNPLGTNNANYFNGAYSDPVNYLTPVGVFASSPSVYGTYDQGGNLWQWNQAINTLPQGGIRGGAFFDSGAAPLYNYLQAVARYDGYPPTGDAYNIGFRVVALPEPGTVAILVMGATGLLMRRRAAK